MERLVIAVLLTVTGAQQSQVEGPENTLSVVGSNVTLKCSSPSRNCSGIDWMKYNAGTIQINIFRDPGGIHTFYRGRYSVENSSGCDLVIKNVQLTDAGRFICRAIISSNTVDGSAYLIILKTQPKCMINASRDATVQGDGVQLTCELTYNGTNKASMLWKDVEDAPAAVENGKTITRFYSSVASEPQVPSFTCVTSFAVETNLKVTGMATNTIPDTTCATPAIRVLYPVRNVQLSPTHPGYSPGTIIACTAEGHPSPTFIWQEMERDEENLNSWKDVHNHCTFSVNNVTSKSYRCVATNVVRGKTHSAASRQFQIKNADELNSDSIFTNGAGIAVCCAIGVFASLLLASILCVILVRLGYVELHRTSVKHSPENTAQLPMHEQEKDSPLSHPPMTADSSNQSREAASAEQQQESSYESLGKEKNVNQYETLEDTKKAKPKKKNRQ